MMGTQSAPGFCEKATISYGIDIRGSDQSAMSLGWLNGSVIW